jgi:hypothetical protein
MAGFWIDQSTRMKGDRFVCGDCATEWPRVALGPPFEHDRCLDCGGLITAVWEVFPGDLAPVRPPLEAL